MSRIDTCPECGGEIEATVKVYLSSVVIEDGQVTACDLASESLGVEVEYYCPESHTDAVEAAVIEGGWPTEIAFGGLTFST